MAWNHTKASKNRRRKKILKAIFGKSLPLVIIIFLLLGVLGSFAYKNVEPFRDFVDSLGILPTTTAPRPTIDPNGTTMAVHFIDVGQGDCTLFETPDGCVLVDCGESEYGEEVVAYLTSLGIDELEYFIITHPDSDHMGCAAYILRNIKVNTFVMNGQEKTTVFFEKALDELDRQNINSIIVAPGERLEVGALCLDILGPQRLDFSEAEWNNASIIIHAKYGERSFLLTGDAEEEGEEDLLAKYKDVIKCDVFSAGHHGSKTSNSPELLHAADPDYVVISCGEGNSYGHPHQQALDVFASVGAIIHRTDKEGTIIFTTDGVTLTKR